MLSRPVTGRKAPKTSDFQKLHLTYFWFSEIMQRQFRSFREAARPANMQYFVVMIDYGRRGREAIVDPEITRRDVVARVASGEYKDISFIHEIADCTVEDVTAEIFAEAALPARGATESDLQAGAFDHIRNLRKHEPV
jgi:hypothetical protein